MGTRRNEALFICIVMGFGLASPIPMWGQTQLFSTWEAGGVVWCGDSSFWSLPTGTEAMPIHQLQAPNAGSPILWGCPTDDAFAWEEAPWHARVHWRQDLGGSNANNSTLFWAEAPSDDPAEASWILASSHQAGWLDDTGGVAAGENGNHDPLRCHAPGGVEWVTDNACHSWSDPFVFDANWTWEASGGWSVDAWDENLRSSRWLDTVAEPTLTKPPCIGIEIQHTSSNGFNWAFGWAPGNEIPTEEDTLIFALEDSSAVTAIQWPTPITPPVPTLSMSCLGQPFELPMPPLPDSGCDNVWMYAMPCILEAGSHLEISLDNTAMDIWSDGTNHLVWGDLAFTEIMADPTPATSAPESHFLEVLNLSDLAFDPEKLSLIDSGNGHSLVWVVSSQDGLVHPGERWVIVDNAQPWLDAQLENVMVARAQGWSGLRDDGETISLSGPSDSPLERLEYLDQWWGDSSQDGRSLSIIHPPSCDHPVQWRPDPDGASPGHPSILEENSASTQPQDATGMLRLNPMGELDIHPRTPWHTDQSPLIQLRWPGQSHLRHASHMWGDDGVPHWSMAWPEDAPRQVQVEWTDVRSCDVRLGSSALDTLWAAHRPAAYGQIQLTEILPSTHPLLDSEFVEWTNVSDDSLAWGDQLWLPGASLVVASCPRKEFRLWMGNQWHADSRDALWQVEETLSLANERGQAQLQDPWGQTVATCSYSVCGHNGPQDVGQGRSMELSFNNAVPEAPCWRTCPESKGMTPGVASQWNQEHQEPQPLPEVSWGVIDNQWAMTVPGGWSWNEWRPHLWEPRTEWQLVWMEGRKMALAPYGPDSVEAGPVHLLKDELSFPSATLAAPNTPSGSLDAPVWNEVLNQPLDGHGAFLELQTGMNGEWSVGWVWSSKPEPQPDDFEPLSEFVWWMPPGKTTCFSQCPNWVQGAVEACLPANMPSLHGERALELRTPNNPPVTLDLTLESSSPWLAQHEGISLARIPETSIWTSTPVPWKCTPGMPNAPGISFHEQPPMSGELRCTPSTVRPAGPGHWDVVLLEWNPPWDEGRYELEYGVLHPSQAAPVQWHEGHWAGSMAFSWTWRGETLDGTLVSAGAYIGFVKWLHVPSGKRGTDRCMIGVAPP